MLVTLTLTKEAAIFQRKYSVASLKDVYIKDDIWLVVYTTDKQLSFVALRYIESYTFDNITRGELDEFGESQPSASRAAIPTPEDGR